MPTLTMGSSGCWAFWKAVTTPWPVMSTWSVAHMGAIIATTLGVSDSMAYNDPTTSNGAVYPPTDTADADDEIAVCDD